MTKGVLTHGLGNLFMGAWGAGVGTASYSENLGAMSITKVILNLYKVHLITFGSLFSLILSSLV